jgi:dihydrofolate synthase/folylpolyglutamate synthase
LNYQDAVAYLESLSRFGSKLGLERMERLLAKLGDPHRDLPCLHIAGTNGKGSTVAMVSSILSEAGLRVGTFTSPHLSSFRERITISGEMISPQAVTRIVEELAPQAETVEGLTKFEFLTALAFCYFQEEAPDLVVLEVGMGGRLDATNVVVPIASGITHLALDHTKRLGSTLPEIAGEKAGIIKAGRPVVVAPQSPEALAVVKRRACELSSPLTCVTPWQEEGQICYRGHSFAVEGSVADFWLEDTLFPQVTVSLPGRHQLANAGVALGLAQWAKKSGYIDPDLWQEAISRGLSKARWPGRMEYFQGKPGLLLDGAHNPDGALRLASSIKEFFPRLRPTVVVGVLKDKNFESMVASLAQIAGRMIITRVDNPRALEPGELAQVARGFNLEVEVVEEPEEALFCALARERELVVVAGSLYLVGELRGEIQRFFSR